MFWLAFRYQIFYILKPETNTGGKAYATALFQLFAGLYTMEISLIGLFCFVRDADGQAAGLYQAGGMCCLLVLTLLFHRQLDRVFCPLFDFPLLELKDGGPGDSFLPALDAEKVFRDRRPPARIVPEDLFAAAVNDQGGTVWIPRDGLGVSDDEIKWSQKLSQDLKISNKGAAIDARGTVAYSQNPPEA